MDLCIRQAYELGSVAVHRCGIEIVHADEVAISILEEDGQRKLADERAIREELIVLIEKRSSCVERSGSVARFEHRRQDGKIALMTQIGHT